MKIEVTHHRLELKTPGLRSSTRCITQEVKQPNPALNRFFYKTVGYNWLWYTKSDWSYDQWGKLVSAVGYETWITYHEGTPIGYSELDVSEEETEIASFGLLPEFTGQGLGREHLNLVITNAWRNNTKLVWLDTCSLDHPAALSNYLARGFEIASEEIRIEDVPDNDLSPWPESGLIPATRAHDHPKVS